MTHAEAKEKVIQAMHIAAIKADCYDECMAINDAMQIACEALDKMIPKKPIGFYYIGSLCTGDCPSCGQKQSYGSIDWHKWLNIYCFKCGQKLDWSDDDD